MPAECAAAKKGLSWRAGDGIKRGMNYLIAGLIGLVGGVASGLFGVGGGIVMVPAMVYLLHLGFKSAIGTSLLVIVPTALVGAFQHARFDQVDWRTALALAPMAIAGGSLGAWLTTQVSAANLKRAFGGFLILVGLRLLLLK